MQAVFEGGLFIKSLLHAHSLGLLIFVVLLITISSLSVLSGEDFNVETTPLRDFSNQRLSGSAPSVSGFVVTTTTASGMNVEIEAQVDGNGEPYSSPLDFFVERDSKSDNPSLYRGGFNRSGAYPTEYIFTKPRYNWTYKGKGKFSTSPVVYNKLIYLVSRDGLLRCIETSSGKQKWYCRADGKITSPVDVVDGTVYFGTSRGFFYGIGHKNGSHKFRIRCYDQPGRADIANISANASSQSITSIIVSRDSAYIGTSTGFIYALDLPRIAVKWKTDEKDHFFRLSSAHTDETGLLIAGNGKNCVTALNIVDGSVAWSHKTRNAIKHSLSILGEAVYYGGFSDPVTALHLHSGKKMWSFRQMGLIAHPLSVGTAGVYFTSGKKFIYGLNFWNGRQLWRESLSDQILSPPVVVGETLLFGCYNNYLYGIDTKTGNRLWKIRTGHPVELSPVAADGYLYFVNMYGELKSFSYRFRGE